MDIIIRPAETSDFDSVVHILNQVQALHVNWRLIFTKKVRIFSLWMLFRMLWIKKLFMLPNQNTGLLEFWSLHTGILNFLRCLPVM